MKVLTARLLLQQQIFDLLQISAEKDDPKHGGEDNLSKSNPFGYEEDNDTKGKKGWN